MQCKILKLRKKPKPKKEKQQFPDVRIISREEAEKTKKRENLCAIQIHH